MPKNVKVNITTSVSNSRLNNFEVYGYADKTPLVSRVLINEAFIQFGEVIEKIRD